MRLLQLLTTRPTRVLEATANIATIVACVVIVGFLAIRERGPSAPEPEPRYKVGDRLPPVNGLRPAGSSQTLFMFLNSECRFCTDSMPFYRRLAEEARKLHAGSKGIRLVAVSRESERTTRQYLAEHELPVDRVVEIPPTERRVNVSGTPTLILADANSTVRAVWVGRLDAEREREVFSAIGGGRTASR